MEILRQWIQLGKDRKDIQLKEEKEKAQAALEALSAEKEKSQGDIESKYKEKLAKINAKLKADKTDIRSKKKGEIVLCRIIKPIKSESFWFKGQVAAFEKCLGFGAVSNCYEFHGVFL